MATLICEHFTPQVRETLSRHLDSISEMVLRDRNHACVVAWSLANEPDSEVRVDLHTIVITNSVCGVWHKTRGGGEDTAGSGLTPRKFT